MKSNCCLQLFTKRKTSARRGRQALFSPSFARQSQMKRWWSRSSSMLITCWQPLDSSSRVMLPVPEKRSNAVASSKSTY